MELNWSVHPEVTLVHLYHCNVILFSQISHFPGKVNIVLICHSKDHSVDV